MAARSERTVGATMSSATGVNLGAALGLGYGGLCLILREFRVGPWQSTSSGRRVWWIARGGRGRTGAPSETSWPRLRNPTETPRCTLVVYALLGAQSKRVRGRKKSSAE